MTNRERIDEWLRGAFELLSRREGRFWRTNAMQLIRQARELLDAR